MDKLILTDTGGFPLKLDDLLWQNGELDSVNWGIYDAIEAHLLAYGTDYIVEGCTYGAPNITAGWIMLAGELMRVDAHAGTDDFFVRTQTFDARGSKTFKDTSVNNTYEKIRGVLSGASGSLNITTALRLEDKIVQLIATSTQQFAVGNIPDLPTSKTTSGVFVDARIPDLAASKITSGVFAVARLPAATTTAIGAVEKATPTEVLAGTAEKYIDAALLQGHGAWQTPSYVDTHSDYTTGDFSGLRYRKLTNGMLQLAGSFQRSVVTAGIVFTLAAGFRPAQSLPIFGRREDDTVVGGFISSAGVVNIFLASAVGGDHMDLNIIVPLDLTV